MSQFKFGMDAIEETNASGGGNSGGGEFAKLPSGGSLKVKLTGLDNIMRYFGYGVYKRVNTFIAENPSDRNDKGYVTDNPTAWDKASQYYYDKAAELLKGVDKDDKEAVKEVKDSKEYKALSSEGFKYSGKARYAVGLIDVEVGKEIVLDFTKKQFMEVLLPALSKYDGKKDKIAFDIAKSGSGTSTVISVSPVIDMDDEADISAKERANFDKFVGKEFNKANFDGLLFEADEKTQVENLVAAGFDISLIGYSIGGVSNDNAPSNNDGLADGELPF